MTHEELPLSCVTFSGFVLLRHRIALFQAPTSRCTHFRSSPSGQRHRTQLGVPF